MPLEDPSSSITANRTARPGEFVEAVTSARSTPPPSACYKISKRLRSGHLCPLRLPSIVTDSSVEKCNQRPHRLWRHGRGTPKRAAQRRGICAGQASPSPKRHVIARALPAFAAGLHARSPTCAPPPGYRLHGRAEPSAPLRRTTSPASRRQRCSRSRHDRPRANPFPTTAATLHVTGEARYTDDLSPLLRARSTSPSAFPPSRMAAPSPAMDLAAVRAAPGVHSGPHLGRRPPRAPPTSAAPPPMTNRSSRGRHRPLCRPTPLPRRGGFSHHAARKAAAALGESHLHRANFRPSSDHRRGPRRQQPFRRRPRASGRRATPIPRCNLPRPRHWSDRLVSSCWRAGTFLPRIPGRPCRDARSENGEMHHPHLNPAPDRDPAQGRRCTWHPADACAVRVRGAPHGRRLRREGIPGQRAGRRLRHRGASTDGPSRPHAL